MVYSRATNCIEPISRGLEGKSHSFGCNKDFEVNSSTVCIFWTFLDRFLKFWDKFWPIFYICGLIMEDFDNFFYRFYQ